MITEKVAKKKMLRKDHISDGWWFFCHSTKYAYSIEVSEEQVAIFMRRCEEGDDALWTKIMLHDWRSIIPGAIPPEKSPCQLSDAFSHVSPLEPIRQGVRRPSS